MTNAVAGSRAGPGPWTIRMAAARPGRAALEVYEHGRLLDVVVASSLGTGLLRGARQCGRGTGRTGFAWGRLPADGSLPVVTFTRQWRGRPSRTERPASVLAVAGAFWLAWAEGPCAAVLVRHGDGTPVRLKARRAAGRCAAEDGQHYSHDRCLHRLSG